MQHIAIRITEIAEPTDGAKANAIGRAFADETLAEIAKRGAPPLLGHVVKAMIAKGRFGGIEVGFFHRIAERATAEPRKKPDFAAFGEA
jgi:hypothetical protein